METGYKRSTADKTEQRMRIFRVTLARLGGGRLARMGVKVLSRVGASSDGCQATLASSDAEREDPSVQVVVREAEARTIMESEVSGVGLVQRSS